MHEILKSKLGWGEEELAAMGERVQAFRSVFVTHDETCWHVEWVACLPEYRGKGYINKLLLAILDKGRTLGIKQVRRATSFAFLVATQR